MAHTYVLGLGNVLMGDDGFGPAAVRAFADRYETDPDVEILDLGTPGLDLTPWFADAAHVVIVDTVKSPEPPGTVRVYHKSDLVRHAPFSRVGPHDPGVKETVLTLEFAGRAPDRITLIGVVPARVGMGLDLSPAVLSAMPHALDAIADALIEAGTPAQRRPASPTVPAPWWQPPAVAAACR